MQPSSTTGIISAGKARTVIRGRSRSGILSPTGKFRLRAIAAMIAIWEAPISRPGTIPAMNR